MASVYHRKESRHLWGKWTDATGAEHRGSLETDDEQEARRRVDELEKLARAETAPATKPGELTVESFARGEWLRLRKVAKPLAWRDDLSRLVHHFLPAFGPRPLAWLVTDDGGRALFAWAVGLKNHHAKRDDKPLAPRSVWNVYSVAKVLLDDAVDLKRLTVNPLASFRTDKYLPAKEDKASGWRETAGFELDQVAALTTDARLRPLRRVWNALAFLGGGARTGEVANLRWREWIESYKGGLGRLTIATAWNSRVRVEKGTKTGAKKIVPVHPFLERTLRAWKESGWREWMGRVPGPEDLIVPRSDGKQWLNGQLLEHFHADLTTLKLALQRQYENRSTFRNLLLRAGAQEFVVNLMTHPSPKQASDFYTRMEMQWPALCGAILLLQHPDWQEQRPTGGGVTAEVTGHGSSDENEPQSESLGAVHNGGVYGTRKRISSASDSAALAPNVAQQYRTRPRLAIAPVPADAHEAASLPCVTSDLFVEAAALAAVRAARGQGDLDQVRTILQRALAQAAVLRVG